MGNCSTKIWMQWLGWQAFYVRCWGDNLYKNKTYLTFGNGINTCQWTKEIFGHLKKPSPKNFQNTWIMIESKEVSWHWKFGSEGKN
jgi:hypothetical protein